MKKKLSYFLLILLLAVLSSCHDHLPAVSPKNSKDFEKALGLMDKQNDSAYYYFNRFIASSKDNLQIAKAFNLMAQIQSGAGDYFGAQESLTQSLKSLEEHNPAHRKCLASDYNELGMVSYNLSDYNSAITLYEQAQRFSDIQALTKVILNNKANAYRKQGDYKHALQLYKSALDGGAKKGREYARLLTNYTFTRWLTNPAFRAAPDLLRALKIRQQDADIWGLNSSYTHLADYYGGLGRSDSGFYYAHAQYQVTQQLKSPDDELQALQKMIRFGPTAAIKPYFIRFQQLTDSLQKIRSAAKNQFALIRYGVEKNRAENLKLQKESLNKTYQLSAVLTLLILGSAWGVWYYRRRQLRLVQETQTQIRQNRLTDSKTVHDTVANDIYRIMKHIEYDNTLDKDWLLENIGGAYQRSRDISYELVKGSEEAFGERLSEILDAFTTEDTAVIVVGNQEELWQKVNATSRFELKHILLELMVNMKKHSEATNVTLRFQDQGDHCLIDYFDDGIGILEGTLPKNGLSNTGNRIQAIRGQFIFVKNDSETEYERGVHIQITFPFA